jgi:hypothetical protein
MCVPYLQDPAAIHGLVVGMQAFDEIRVHVTRRTRIVKEKRPGRSCPDLRRGRSASGSHEGRSRSSSAILSAVTLLRDCLTGSFRRERLLASLENLVTMLESGVALEAGLRTLATVGARRRGKAPAGLLGLHEAIIQGRPLSAAMMGRPGEFDDVDVALVRAGEESGELTSAFRRLVARRRLGAKLSSTLATALAYPAFLMVFGGGVVVFLASYVMPDLNAMLVAGGGRVPVLTRTRQGMAWMLTIGLLPALFAIVVGGVLVMRRFLYLAGTAQAAGPSSAGSRHGVVALATGEVVCGVGNQSGLISRPQNQGTWRAR